MVAIGGGMVDRKDFPIIFVARFSERHRVSDPTVSLVRSRSCTSYYWSSITHHYILIFCQFSMYNLT